MKTVEGEEIKLGELTLMPVKNYVFKVTDEQIEQYKNKKLEENTIRIHHCKIENCRVKGDHVHIERSPFYQTQQYIEMVIEEYKLYYDKVLAKIKPANYND